MCGPISPTGVTSAAVPVMNTSSALASSSGMIARKRGIKVTERAIMPEELAKADEVFITGTAAEVTPVGEIGPHNYQVGPLARQMMSDYAATVRGQKVAA